MKEKVCCRKCKHLYENIASGLCLAPDCNHPSCFREKYTPLEKITVRFNNYQQKNAQNACKDYEEGE